MKELFKIVDEWKDRNGAPSDASIARVIGVSEQTFNHWRKKGLKSAPRDKEPFRKMAEHFGLPYDEVIVQALAVDLRLRDEMPEWRWPERGRGSA